MAFLGKILTLPLLYAWVIWVPSFRYGSANLVNGKSVVYVPITTSLDGEIMLVVLLAIDRNNYISLNIININFYILT